ncbi:MAG: cytochrome-c peroxidase [Anaerolineae bacterium]
MGGKRFATLCVSLGICFVLFGALGTAQVEGASPALSSLEQLGKHLFFDENLSVNGTQSCASCHAPEAGFTGPDSVINAGPAIYPGALHSRNGNRKPPTAAYGGYSPVLYYDSAEEVWVGGMFWDGRATGWVLGDPLAEQAQGPFLNPLEQALPDAQQVCIRVMHADYAWLFEQAWGAGSLDCGAGLAETYDRIGLSISAYEQSAEVNPFSSKYDAYLAGLVRLTPLERRGLKLFEGRAMCSACHPSQPGPNGEPPLFTDFTYDNLGIPRNPQNPFYTMPQQWNPDGWGWIDPGLGGFLQSAGYDSSVYMAEWGKHKVPTLRNVDMRPYPGFVRAYGHNGYFKSLEEIVHFYNTRDVESWPAPEVALNVNTDELGDLGLKPKDEEALVAFLRTLTDGYMQ